jgi:hypothetical protein
MLTWPLENSTSFIDIQKLITVYVHAVALAGMVLPRSKDSGTIVSPKKPNADTICCVSHEI